MYILYLIGILHDFSSYCRAGSMSSLWGTAAAASVAARALGRGAREHLGTIAEGREAVTAGDGDAGFCGRKL